jgi:hypothetical protein
MTANTLATQDAKPEAGPVSDGSVARRPHMKQAFPGSAGCLALLLVCTPMLAHHSFSAIFDPTKLVTLTGVITRVDWGNPHVYFYADVKDEHGVVVNWTFQIASPQLLVKHGWTRDTLRVHDHISVTGYRARGEASVASAREVVLPDGRKLFTGSPDGGPQ